MLNEKLQKTGEVLFARRKPEFLHNSHFPRAKNLRWRAHSVTTHEPDLLAQKKLRVTKINWTLKHPSE